MIVTVDIKVCLNGALLAVIINFSGIDCSIPMYKSHWTTVKYQDHVGVSGVASHSSVLYGKYLWLVGGYSFQLTHSLRILRLSGHVL